MRSQEKTGYLQKLDYSILQQCIHCGMCLPTCPTYDETRLEKSSPRGRIALMRAVADGDLDSTKSFADEMYYCLGCLACMTACPAGVDYANLIEHARAHVEQEQILGGQRRFWRWFTLQILFMRPRLLRLVGRGLWLFQVSGLEKLVHYLRLTTILPKRLRELEPQTPRILARFSHQRIHPVESVLQSTKRYRVGLLTGCVQDLTFADVNEDTAYVLRRNGCEVVTPPVQPCCGSLHGHNGEPELAKILARRMIDLFPVEELDAIITNAGGCGSHLKHYGRLLAEDSQYAEKAKLWDKKLYDANEWLAQIGCESALAEHTRKKATYHDSCHLCHGQGITRQPRELLKKIAGFTMIDLPEASWCCGSAGIYNITQPEQSQKLLDRKIKNIASTHAEVVVLANPGCHLQVARGLRDNGMDDVRVIHPMTALAEAYKQADANRVNT